MINYLIHLIMIQVLQTRNELSHVSVGIGIAHIEKARMDGYFESLRSLVDRLAILYPSHFTLAQEIREQLLKVSINSIKSYNTTRQHHASTIGIRNKIDYVDFVQ